MEHIDGGAFQVARKIFQSQLWTEKPCSWKIIWLYIIGKVSHQDQGKFKRGVGYFNFAEERCLIGKDISPDTIKKATTYFKKSEMIRTTKSTRGMYIEVLNYNTYQEMDNYKAPRHALSKHFRSTTEALLYNKNDKNDKNDKNTYMSVSTDAFESFWANYPKKEQKKKALDIWKRKKLDDKLPELLTFIEKAKVTDRWKKGFIKMPTAFLNGECWNDDLSSYMDKTFNNQIQGSLTL